MQSGLVTAMMRWGLGLLQQLACWHSAPPLLTACGPSDGTTSARKTERA